MDKKTNRKIAILHFSDIHLKDSDNIILERTKEIAAAISNDIIGVDHLYILVCGDITYSGKEEEYKQAKILIDEIKIEIKKIITNNVGIILIPGNHDCDFDKTTTERNSIVQKVQGGSINLDNKEVDVCCSIQKEFFKFKENYNFSIKLFKDNLLEVKKFISNRSSIIFNCFNTSWMSQKEEKPGVFYYPYKKYEKRLKNRADLIISVLHHPFNWCKPEFYRKFKKFVERNSHIIILGHDHYASFTQTLDLSDSKSSEYIEGKELQSLSYKEDSYFNVIIFNLKDQTHKIIKYKWDGEFYKVNGKPIPWTKYRNKGSSVRRKFEISEIFENFLLDPGASFTHPSKEDINLNDIFIFPDLLDYVSVRLNKDEILKNIISSEGLKRLDDNNNILIIGSEMSGKSTLLKVLFKHYYNNNLIPIYIEGNIIRSSGIEDFIEITEKKFCEEYSKNDLTAFRSLNKNKIVILIDDFEKVKPAYKYRVNLLENIGKHYPNIIITGNELLHIEELVTKNTKTMSVFERYQIYEIMEFGNYLRSKLIDKWNRIGLGEDVDDRILQKSNDISNHFINLIIREYIVPSYPIFLLTILTAKTAAEPMDLTPSSFGHYYHFLIQKDLLKLGLKNDEVGVYHNFLTNLSFYFHEQKIKEIPESDLCKLHKDYCDDFDISASVKKFFNFNILIENLLKANILKEESELLKFKYKYIYFYYLGKYFSDNLHKDDIKIRIEKMCKRVYISEFANAILFLIYHSQNPLILECIYKSSVSIFNDYSPIKMEEDIAPIDSLIGKIPQLVIENKNIKKYRKESLKEKDEVEIKEKEDVLKRSETDYNLDDSLSPTDIIPRLNLSFKTIEIIGQILKVYWGKMLGEEKLKLGEELYRNGLRTLNAIFTFLKQSLDDIIDEIKAFIKNEKIVDKDTIERISRKALFYLFFASSYVVIKKISNSIGTRNLDQTYDKIQDNNNFISTNLINLSIKLDFPIGFPFRDLKRIYQKINTQIPKYILKRLVIDHIYMFEVKIEDKQRIAGMLGIPIKKQLTVSKNSKKKRKL